MDGENKVTEKNDISEAGTKRVPDRLQQKFESLRKRRLEMCKRSTEKRVKQIQEDVLRRVEEEFTKDEDLDMLREHDVVLPGNTERKKNRDQSTAASTETGSCSQPLTTENYMETSVNPTHWKAVQKYLGCNDHIKGLDKGKYTAKTKLHVDIEEAVGKGEFDRAEKLSDDLATREFGTKIAEAFDAKNYADKKEVDKETAKSKKKKKLHWGFEHKQKWETKSNM